MDLRDRVSARRAVVMATRDAAGSLSRGPTATIERGPAAWEPHRETVHTYGRPGIRVTRDALSLFLPPDPLSFALGFSRVSTRFRRPRRVTHAPRATLSVPRSISLPLLYTPTLCPFLSFSFEIEMSRVPLSHSEFLPQNLEYVFP